MRIGLFGGTFNPIHNGHLQTVVEVRLAFSLERVVLIPAAVPPHKPASGIAGAEDRMAMARLAVAGSAGLSVSDVEIQRRGVSYSIDTVSHFQETLAPEAGLCFIVGLDAFLEIDTWKAHEALLEKVPFIVMTRPGTGGGGKTAQQQAIGIFLRRRVSGAYAFSETKNAFTHPQKPALYMHEVTPMPISSTQIRNRIGRGAAVSDLVPAPVNDYIRKKGLYR
jgi:nicotinate-nucleotide adenylyltransferase